jgi:hypothetical protein
VTAPENCDDRRAARVELLGHTRGAGAGDRGPAAAFGSFRARDGSAGGPVAIDVDGPHAGLVVGKRGYGKSYTLGVLAEELARAAGVAPVVVDPMGVFRSLSAPADGDAVPARVVDAPTINPGAIPPQTWCDLLDLDPGSGAGSLLWRAVSDATDLSTLRERIAQADATATARRAATNHVDLADSWGVFDPDGLDADALASGPMTVLDVSGLDAAPANAVVRAVARTLYEARVDGRVERLPWLLVDEAHAFFDGVAGSALRTLLTRGRQPGVSLVAATQRPGALPSVAVSQSDLLVVHRLTDATDREALERARPSYVDASFAERMPTAPGEALVVDDTTERVHAVAVRERDTPHGGASPRASDVDGQYEGSSSSRANSMNPS